MRHLTTLALAILLLAAIPAHAQRTPVNEWKSTTPTYTVVGNGLNYHNGSAWVASNKAVKADNKNFFVDEAGLAWSIAKQSRDITFTRDGIDTTFGFDGMYWFNTATEAWTAIDSANNVTPTQSGDTVLVPGLYDGVDVEIISNVSGPQVDYIITDMSGWTANPYGADGVLAFWHELKSRGHGLKVDGVTWNGTDYTLGDNVTLTGAVRDFDIVKTEAEDATGETAEVTNALIRAVNKDFFGESVDAMWLASATLPVRMHYDVKSGTISASETWSGTIAVIGDVTVASGVTVTVSAGTVVKGAIDSQPHLSNGSGGGTWDINGTVGSPVYFTSCNDSSMGDSTKSAGSCTGGTEGSPLPGDWEGIHWIAGATLYIDNAVIRYCGGSAGTTCFGGTGLANGLDVVVDGLIFDNWRDSSHTAATAIHIIMTTSATSNTVTMKNVLIDASTTDDATDEIVYAVTGSDADNEITLRNFLIVYGGAGGGALFLSSANSTVSLLDVDNVTVICTDDTNSANEGFWVDRTNGLAGFYHNNVVVGCGIGYHGKLGDPTHDYNMAFNTDTPWSSSWVDAGANEIETTPDFTAASGHTPDSTWGPSWATPYHLGASSTADDAGSQTATAAGLDARHTVAAGTNDTGTVDLGFHFYTPVESSFIPGAHFYRRHMQ